MELHADDVVIPRGAAEVALVVGSPDLAFPRGKLDVVRVKEVEAHRLLKPCEDWVAGAGTDVVPAHVGQASGLSGPRWLEPAHIAVDPSKARQNAFVAPSEHHLKSNADPEDGNAPAEHGIIKGLSHSRLIEQTHCPVEGSDSGQDQPWRLGQLPAPTPSSKE